ncbi:MAG: DegT/DnrJ/EryC1/StrS family aminotransferase [Anaerolineales bacterium]
MDSRYPPVSIPMSSPDLTDAEREAVVAVLNTTNLSMGPQIEAFENSIRKFTGCRYAIGVNSGTAGLHLCVRAAGIQDGDLVITSSFSFVASTNVILFERAIPVFVDIDPLTGNLNPKLVKQAVMDLTQGGDVAENWLPRFGHQGSGRLKAILPIDVFGQPADLDPIYEIAQEYDLMVIEDSCEALGAEYRGRKAGTLGDYGVYAFYPNKQITTSEGGMIVTNNERAAKLMSALRNQGRAPGDKWLNHTQLGYNYRLNELSAALGQVQMTRLDELLYKREQVAKWYNQRISIIPNVDPPTIVPSTTRMSWFVYVVRFAPEINRDFIARELKIRGIPARPYFTPIHLQPYMVDRFGYRQTDYPITEELGGCSLALPFSGVMTKDQVEYVCEQVGQVIELRN